MNQMLTKVLIVSGFVAFTGAGLVGADRTFRPAPEPVALAPQPGPAVQRDGETVATPRECDAARNIHENCEY